MFGTYISHLYNQYCEAAGKSYDLANLITDKDFITWLNLLPGLTARYRQYLNCLGIELDCYLDIELSKGKYDSLGTDYVTMVSSYASTLGLNNSEMIVQSEPHVIVGSSLYLVDNCDRFLTHNPFQSKTINDMIKLHNMGRNICFGMYGSVYDKDRLKKIKILDAVASSLNDEFEFNYDTCDKAYFSFIRSKNKTEMLIKTL